MYSSKPLSYNGQLISDFWISFERGRAVSWGAKENGDLLSEIIQMDEGASYLGEVALVPYDSPIQKSNLLFYNTLFDENAVCHLVLGRGFHNCLSGFEARTFEENTALGVNDSIIHEDFMIGTDDLSITATLKSGEQICIFENGGWAF